MKKRILAWIVSVLMVTSMLSAIPAFASDVWDGSAKTEAVIENSVYQISNGAELAWFAEQTKTDSQICAVLTDDIDLGDKEWTPIGIPASGYITEAYAGTFDGQNHTISGLRINTSSAFYGLFYCVYGGTVKNVNVKGNVATTGNTAGGIVGKLQGGTVENCSFDGSVIAKGNYVGGIVANIVTNSEAASTITGCCNSGEINGKYAGGILGYTTAKATISHCYNTGTINGTTRSAGISGQQTTGNISYCYNIGSSASGIYGFSNASITNCYYLNDETVTSGGTASGYEKIADKSALLDLLNAGSEKPFSEDKNNINNGYPVLSWQASGEDITIPPVEEPEVPDDPKDDEPKTDFTLEDVLDSLKYDFKLLQPVYGQDSNMIVKFQNLLKSKGFDGVKITLKSTSDESLVTSNGKIHYPSLDENSFANGKQVQIYFNLTLGDKIVTYPTSNVNALLIPWDTSSVKDNLEKSSDELLKDTDLSAVTNNLELTSCVKGNKYSFAWVEWKSSDESHLAISDDNRSGSADALYNFYIGKVYQDAEEHNVTLTATVTNPSTDVSVTKIFEVTIPALSDDELNQNLDMMSRILACYTADKLTDSATKQPIDIYAVDGDIQLVIPSKVVTADELAKLDYGKYWDYWNYKFTVTSSDTDVIEINSFRAYVYRPLGENSSADKAVTLTVKMASKTNPNLFVTKDIDVTVKHLSRQELNDAMSLMDAAKEKYANGLLGNNADVYSIIDNLTPYQEIVWNSDKSDVNFIRTHSDIQGNGILVDTLPNWEEQEDWRLFRTSNKDLISNETLILNQTPAENTFVKISSVLTDEVFGKYYTKFQNDSSYDVEALAKFKQLYKQPVSAYVMALGNGNYDEVYASTPTAQKAAVFSARLFSFKTELDKPISVTFTLLGLNGETLISKVTENSFTTGSMVFDVFKKVLSDNHMTYTAKGSYISSINGLAEKDHGSGSGWMYTVGNVFVNSYMNGQELLGGEDIVVMYVTDYAKANLPKDNTNDNNNQNVNKPSDPTGSQNNSNEQSDSCVNDDYNTGTGGLIGQSQDTNNSKNNSNSKSESNSGKSTVKSKASSNNNSSKSAVTSDNKNAAEDDKNTASAGDTNITDDTDTANAEKLETAEKDKAPDVEKKSDKSLIIIGAVAGVLLFALILFLIIRKKKKQ